MIDWDENKPQALVLTPTRELAMQVGEDFFNIGRFKRLKVVPIYGPFFPDICAMACALNMIGATSYFLK